MKPDDLYSLSPDAYSRFYYLAYLLSKMVSENQDVTILDIGGASPYLFLALKSIGIKFNLSVLDIIDKPAGLPKEINYIKGDATSTNKIRLESFDFVISTDTLEHIPNKNKPSFVKSCLKYARVGVIISGPFDTIGVDEAESQTNDFNIKLFGVGQKWLQEHFIYGKPKISDVVKVIINMEYEYDIVGINNLYSWLISTHANLIEAKLGLKQEGFKKLNAIYNKQIDLSGELNTPTYRQAVVVYKKPLALRARGHLMFNKRDNNKDTTIDYISGIFELLADKIITQKKEIEDLRSKLNTNM